MSGQVYYENGVPARSFQSVRSFCPGDIDVYLPHGLYYATQGKLYSFSTSAYPMNISDFLYTVITSANTQQLTAPPPPPPDSREDDFPEPQPMGHSGALPSACQNMVAPANPTTSAVAGRGSEAYSPGQPPLPAETPQLAEYECFDSPPQSPPKKRRLESVTVLTAEKKQQLEMLFSLGEKLANKEQRLFIGQLLGLPERMVLLWYRKRLRQHNRSTGSQQS